MTARFARPMDTIGVARVAAVMVAGVLWLAGVISATADVAGGQQPGAPPAAADSARTADSLRADSARRAHHALAPVVVTGTRLSDVDERTPTQVEPLDIRHALPGPTAAISALERLPGISLFDDQGTRLQPQLEVRGFTVSPIVGTPQGVNVFLDGVRVNEPDAQEVNFDLLPMAAVDRASLVRGSEAALFGRNSLGGTLLLFTRRGTDTPETSGQLGVGSFGEQIATVTAGGKTGSVDGFLAASGSNEAGWRQATSANTRQVFATAGHQWGAAADTGDVAVSVLYAHDRIFEAGSLPESFIAVDPRINYTPGDFFAPELLHLSARGNQALAGGVLRATLFGRRNNYEQFNVNIPPPNSDDFIGTLSGGGTVEWTRPLHLGRVPVGLTVGGEYARQVSHFRLLTVGGGQPDSVTTLASVHEDDAAAFGQAIVTLSPSLTVTGGVRGDYVRIPYRDALDPSNSGTSTYDQFSPEIGLNYRVSDDVRGYLAYKSGFRAPAPLELACASPTAPCSLPSALGADPPLRPVTTRDYETGIDIDLPHRSNLDVDAFWTDVVNDIQFTAPTLTQVFFINVPRTRRAGVEVSAQVGLPAGARAFASYSYVAATFQSTVQIASADTAPRPARPGDLFPSSPLHRARVGAGITRLLGPALVDGELSMRGFSGQFLRGDESNQRPEVAGYVVADLRARATVSRYEIALEIDNLFDRRYATFGIEAQNTLGTPGSTTPVPNPQVVPFLTPGYPRRFVLTVGAHL
jgi:iron complex outermembrane recepter protein